MSKKAIIIQGGGFKTGFSAGVLDAFLEKQYNPFDLYAGVSGGAIAISYFLTNKKGNCLDAIYCLTDDNRFINYRNIIRSKPVMDVDFFKEIANELVPFDIETALASIKDKQLGIVMTNSENGEPHYFEPTRDTWVEALIASSTIPIVSKGVHKLGEELYMDGAWSDALPIKWAVDQGATDILIIRTTGEYEKVEQSWMDYFGELYHWRKKEVKRIFQTNHIKFNQSLEFIANPPAGVKITQIAPDKKLYSDEHTNSSKLVKKDYDFGYAKGMEYLDTI